MGVTESTKSAFRYFLHLTLLLVLLLFISPVVTYAREVDTLWLADEPLPTTAAHRAAIENGRSAIFDSGYQR